MVDDFVRSVVFQYHNGILNREDAINSVLHYSGGISREQAERMLGRDGTFESVWSMAKQLARGIFWVITDDSSLSNWKLLMFDIPCDVNGDAHGDLAIKPNAKSGVTYNHKRIWDEMVKNNNEYRPFNKMDFNFYPRGRVEISNNKATIFLSPHINRQDIVDGIKKEFGLSSYNVPNVRVVSDGSKHYQCFLDRE